VELHESDFKLRNKDEINPLINIDAVSKQSILSAVSATPILSKEGKAFKGSKKNFSLGKMTE